MSFKSFDELPALMTVTDLADVLQISQHKAFNLTRAGSLRVLRVYGQIRVEKQSFLDYLETLQQTA